VKYEIGDRPKDKTIKSQYLDPNHTHFLLVDNSQLNTFGGEIMLRFRLEKEMFEGRKTDASTSRIPVIMIVIDGGPNTVKCVLESLKADIPVLVLDVINNYKLELLIPFKCMFY